MLKCVDCNGNDVWFKFLDWQMLNHAILNIVIETFSSSTSTSATTSFSNGKIARASEPVSFWRENEIAVFI